MRAIFPTAGSKFSHKVPGTLCSCSRTLSARGRAGDESSGSLLAPAIALGLEAGFVPVRKPGKLPWKTVAEEYELEYGRDRLEIHVDAVRPDEKVLIVDALLATGGTASAAHRLVQRLKGVVVGCGFLVELTFLEGRGRLPGADVVSLIQY